MDTTHFAALRRSLTAAASRRGILAAATGGLLAARQLADGGTASDAKKKRNRKRKGKNNRKKKDSGETRADAICPGPTDNFGVALNDGGDRAAQTFTALTSGRLVQAELLIAAAGSESADLILQLRDIDADGVPTAEVLAETSVASSDIPSGENTIVFSFTSPPLVTERGYALVLSKRGTRSISWKGHGSSSCEGRAFFSESSNDPFEPEFDDRDLIFSTFVQS